MKRSVGGHISDTRPIWTELAEKTEAVNRKSHPEAEIPNAPTSPTSYILTYDTVAHRDITSLWEKACYHSDRRTTNRTTRIPHPYQPRGVHSFRRNGRDRMASSSSSSSSYLKFSASLQDHGSYKTSFVHTKFVDLKKQSRRFIQQC